MTRMNVRNLQFCRTTAKLLFFMLQLFSATDFYCLSVQSRLWCVIWHKVKEKTVVLSYLHLFWSSNPRLEMSKVHIVRLTEISKFSLKTPPQYPPPSKFMQKHAICMWCCTFCWHVNILRRPPTCVSVSVKWEMLAADFFSLSYSFKSKG